MHSSEHLMRSTRFAFFWIRVLGTPFWSLLNFLVVILYKDLHITPFQVATLIALKPLSALFAPYWSLFSPQKNWLISTIRWATFLQYLPFLFLPWISSSWVIVFLFGFYMMLHRGVIPAWMELFKRNFPEIARERIFSYSTVLDYVGSALFPLFVGFLLDHYYLSWRWLLPLAALMGLSSLFFLRKIPINLTEGNQDSFSLTLSEKMAKPWVDSWNLLRRRSDFAYFQWSFMVLGGAGLMIIQPALPHFFVDVLNLSYTNMLLAIAFCKGIGLICSSPFWLRLFRKISIYQFSGLATFIAFCFPLILLISPFHLSFLYIAYIFYGVMQGGSELGWHMSGPLFSQKEESSVYSRTNILTVGIRGCIFPFLGNALYQMSSATTVMIVGSLFCLLATQQLFRFRQSRSIINPIG